MRNLALITFFLTIFGCSETSVEQFELAINGARVIDPESGTDAILNIGVSNGTIVELSTDELAGDTVIDAQGKIAIPGFIDVHTHSPFPFGESLQAADGVTTALDLEAGALPVTAYGDFFEEGARLN